MHRSGRDYYGFLGFDNNFKLRLYKKPKHVTFYRAYRYIGSVRYQIESRMSTLHCLLGRRLGTPSIKLQGNLLSHQLPQNITSANVALFISFLRFLSAVISTLSSPYSSIYSPIIPYDSKYFKLHCAVRSRF